MCERKKDREKEKADTTEKNVFMEKNVNRSSTKLFKREMSSLKTSQEEIFVIGRLNGLFDCFFKHLSDCSRCEA